MARIVQSSHYKCSGPHISARPDGYRDQTLLHTLGGRLEEAKQFKQLMKSAGYVAGDDERTEAITDLLCHVHWQSEDTQ